MERKLVFMFMVGGTQLVWISQRGRCVMVGYLTVCAKTLFSIQTSTRDLSLKTLHLSPKRMILPSLMQLVKMFQLFNTISPLWDLKRFLILSNTIIEHRVRDAKHLL